MEGPAEGHRGFGFGQTPILMGFLSLQLMLLAFFIVLTSMSSFDETRVRSALGSIQGVFAEMPGANDGPDAEAGADALAVQAVRDEVVGVFATALELDRIERTGDGAVEIEVASGRLFVAGGDQLLPGTDALLHRVVAALERRPAGYRYELDVLVGRAAGDPGAGSAGSTLEVARSGGLVRAFVAAGAMPSGLAAGLRPGSPERVRLALRLIPGARAANLFGQPPERRP